MTGKDIYKMSMSKNKSKCKIYENSGHWQFIPDMFVEFFRKYYGKK